MPAFTDWVGMVEGNASMYLASPRIAEKVTGESHHAGGDGRGHDARHRLRLRRRGVRRRTGQAIAAARLLLSYPPRQLASTGPRGASCEPEPRGLAGRADPGRPERRATTCSRSSCRMVDDGSFFEIKARWAREMVTGLAGSRADVVGIVANQPSVRSGAIFVDSADKATRFISLCDAFNIPLVFLQDVPGFMVGVAVERQGIIRHGAKMITAMASSARSRSSPWCCARRMPPASTPCAAPGFEPRATLALPTATIGTMSAEASVERGLRQQDRRHRGPRGAGRVRRGPPPRAGSRFHPAAHGRRVGRRHRRGPRLPPGRVGRPSGCGRRLDPHAAGTTSPGQPGMTTAASEDGAVVTGASGRKGVGGRERSARRRASSPWPTGCSPRAWRRSDMLGTLVPPPIPARR